MCTALPLAFKDPVLFRWHPILINIQRSCSEERGTGEGSTSGGSCRCQGSLRRKKLGRDPFSSINVPYPNACPETESLFRHCREAPYSGSLPELEPFYLKSLVKLLIF
uniref:Uncharacterized protein C57A10.07 n=1 Tax=Rhizophora mucronata TaxID=61149 RepID=A0A2P2MPA8_RHIMU